MAAKEYRHWTKHGTIRLVFDQNGPGGLMVAVYLDEKLLAPAASFPGAAEGIWLGSYDVLLGFSAAEAGVPRDLSQWSDPLDVLDSLK